MILLFQLLAAHALCDYPLQGDFLARGKNHRQPIPGVPFYWCLLSHALIHGGAVMWITGFPVLGLFEFVVHALIDYLKCDGIFGFDADQIWHVSCKVMWVALVLSGSRA